MNRPEEAILLAGRGAAGLDWWATGLGPGAAGEFATRRAVVLIAGVVVLIVAFAASCVALRSGATGPSTPEQAASDCFRAWRGGDFAATRRLVADPPADFADRHRALSQALRVNDVAFRPGVPVRTGDSASVNLHGHPHPVRRRPVDLPRGPAASPEPGTVAGAVVIGDPVSGADRGRPAGTHPSGPGPVGPGRRGRPGPAARQWRAAVPHRDRRPFRLRRRGRPRLDRRAPDPRTLRRAPQGLRRRYETGPRDAGPRVQNAGRSAECLKVFGGGGTKWVRATLGLEFQSPGRSAECLKVFGGGTKPVRTTLDRRLQTAADRAAAALVAVRPSTGEVLAVADRLEEPRGALMSLNPPGSTFKVVTGAALLDDGMAPDTPVDYPAVALAAQRTIHNDAGFALGRVPLGRAFAESCNTTFATLGVATGERRLRAAAAAFGFGSHFDPGVPAYAADFPAGAEGNALAKAARAGPCRGGHRPGTGPGHDAGHGRGRRDGRRRHLPAPANGREPPRAGARRRSPSSSSRAARAAGWPPPSPPNSFPRQNHDRENPSPTPNNGATAMPRTPRALITPKQPIDARGPGPPRRIR
jgi:hypothetical protein